MVQNARLCAEIIDDRIAIPTHRLFRDILQHRLELSQVLTLTRCSVLDEFLPRLRIRQSSIVDAIENFIFCFYSNYWTLSAPLKEFLSVVLGYLSCQSRPFG